MAWIESKRIVFPYFKEDNKYYPIIKWHQFTNKKDKIFPKLVWNNIAVGCGMYSYVEISICAYTYL